MPQREFRASDVSALTGLNTNQVLKWAQMGLLWPRKGKPRGNPRGHGRAVYFSERDVFVAAMARTLCQQGMTLSYVKPVTRFLNELTIEQIAEAAESNKVLVAAGAAMKPRFVEFDSMALGQAASDASKSQMHEMLLTLSMSSAWNKFQAGMKHFEQYVAAPAN